MNTRALLPLLPLLTGCLIISPTDNDDNADSTSGDGDDDDRPGDGDGDSTTGDGDGDGDGDGEGDGDGDGDEWCHLSEENPGAPWFSLSQFGEPLQSGGDLQVECGFQGFFMIEIDPTVGGFIPDSEHVPFHATLDVEGYNIGPNGHFAEGNFGIFVGCCDDYYYGYCYEGYTLRLYPPDMIDDLSVIHGAPAVLTVTMTAGDEPIEQTFDVNMWAMDEGAWEYCEYYYPNVEPLPIASSSIPG